MRMLEKTVIGFSLIRLPLPVMQDGTYNVLFFPHTNTRAEKFPLWAALSPTNRPFPLHDSTLDAFEL